MTKYDEVSVSFFKFYIENGAYVFIWKQGERLGWFA